MSEYFIAPIVEGHGEVEALPILLHRIFQESGAVGVLRVNQPQRVKAQSFLQLGDEFARHVGARRSESEIVPAWVRPYFVGTATMVAPRKSVQCSSRMRWCSGQTSHSSSRWRNRSLSRGFSPRRTHSAGTSGLPQNLRPPPEPESKRGAKEWLSERLKRRYNEPNDQPNFTRIFDLDEAATVPSFARLRAKLRHFFQSC